ncbi:MAG: TetR/AcrR family transcriptional regulator [Candidatus Alectryocaccobium sp.]|jgi:AcrR family transcriptional regulator
MSKVSDNKLHKKNQLLDTAFKLFTTKGISETSVSDITKEAKVGKGTFYLYFKDKYELEAKLISRRAAKLFQHAENALANYPKDISLEDKAVILVGDLIDQLANDPSLLKFIYKNLSWGIFRNAIKQQNSDYDSDIYYSFDKLINDYKDEFIEPDLMLYTIVELASSTCYNVILWSDPVSLDVYKLFLDKNIRAIMNNHKKGK